MTAPSPGPSVPPDDEQRRALRRRIVELEQQLAEVPELEQELEDQRARAAQLDGELQATLAALQQEQAERALDEQQRAALRERVEALEAAAAAAADRADGAGGDADAGGRGRDVVRRSLRRLRR